MRGSDRRKRAARVRRKTLAVPVLLRVHHLMTSIPNTSMPAQRRLTHSSSCIPAAYKTQTRTTISPIHSPCSYPPDARTATATTTMDGLLNQAKGALGGGGQQQQGQQGQNAQGGATGQQDALGESQLALPCSIADNSQTRVSELSSARPATARTRLRPRRSRTASAPLTSR